MSAIVDITVPKFTTGGANGHVRSLKDGAHSERFRRPGLLNSISVSMRHVFLHRYIASKWLSWYWHLLMGKAKVVQHGPIFECLSFMRLRKR